MSQKFKCLFSILMIVALSVTALSCRQGESGEATEAREGPGQAEASGGAAGEEKAPEGLVLLVIAQNDFQDIEFKTVRGMLTDAGYKVSVAAPKRGAAIGVSGFWTDADLALSVAKASQYSAVVFIGGPGAKELFDLGDAHRLAREAVSEDKVLAAICLAPVILARAGVLTGKNATVYPSASHDLTDGGARYTGVDVEVDGKIITASGPEASSAFAQAIITALR